MGLLSSSDKPFGMPIQNGRVILKSRDWHVMRDFIESRIWYFKDSCLSEDATDPLINADPGYGLLMMGFDFHITPTGPRLIEINTNAGGYVTAMLLAPDDRARKELAHKFVAAAQAEYAHAAPRQELKRVAIVDDDFDKQALYPEMLHLAEILSSAGIETHVLEPSQFQLQNKQLDADGFFPQLIYNRLVDFRLAKANHAHIREALLNQTIAISPHPAVYSRCADKRNFLRLKHAIIPRTLQLKDRPMEEWEKERKRWFFKPPTGNASKGVYRGDKLSRAKLVTLPPETIVQEMIEPSRTPDGCKYDIRVFTRDTEILAVVGRQYSGQVMEMNSEKSGFVAIEIGD